MRWFWVVLVGFVGGFGSFWVVLLVVLDGFGWFWVVLGGFGWFRVLVTTPKNDCRRFFSTFENFEKNKNRNKTFKQTTGTMIPLVYVGSIVI